MKRYICFLAGLMMVSTAAVAAGAECVGGTLITANSTTNNPNGNCTATTCNGATFCKSNGTMNWWTAFTWCASNGRHLVTFQEACPGIATQVNDTRGACPNLQGLTTNTQYVWTELGSGSNFSLYVNLSSGSVDNRHYRTDGQYALCK